MLDDTGKRRVAMTYTIPPFPLYNPKPLNIIQTSYYIDKNKFYEKTTIFMTQKYYKGILAISWIRV
jgi:hypothetical protein